MVGRGVMFRARFRLLSVPVVGVKESANQAGCYLCALRVSWIERLLSAGDTPNCSSTYSS